jgi:hypothetical protein
MFAHIRVATRKEIPGFLRPLACVFDGHVCYTFNSWREEIALAGDAPPIKAERDDQGMLFRLPRGALSISSSADGWLFDGEPVREVWPTSNRRELVTGRFRFKVVPEDDTLLFECPDGCPDLATAIVGFYVYARRGDGGISS